MGFYLKIGLYRIPPYSVFGLGEFHPIIQNDVPYKISILILC